MAGRAKNMKDAKSSEYEAACEDCSEKECCESGFHNCGSHSHWHGSWAKKKIMLGIGFIALAFLWYAKNTGYLNPALFWPLVFGLAGVGLFLKGMWLKKHEEQCCGRC